MNEILEGDCLAKLKEFPDESVDCIITSPPYWALRDYGVAGQLGLEKTPELYIKKMVEIFRECRRVLKEEGTLWVNIGDSYKDKNLVGVPWMLAFALRADGWYLRQDIIWHKPNPMPESVRDRCTKSHEYVFMFSKNVRYYYDADAIKTEGKNPQDHLRRLAQQKNGNKSEPNEKQNGLRIRIDKQRGHSRRHAGFNERWDAMPREEQMMKANKRSVWSVATMPFREAHFATFPEKLVEPMIKAGCPLGGVVLDPFMGAGTTALVALKLDRQYLGIELNPAYIKIAEERLGPWKNKLFSAIL